MMKRNILAVVIPALLAAGAANAAEVYNKDGNKLDLYGKAVGLHYFSDDDGYAGDGDQSYIRLGFKGETQINDMMTGFGQWEYEFRADNSEGEDAQEGNKTRLGFAGLKFGNYGSFDYGRNYGIAYDALAWTDVLPEFGGDFAQSDTMTSRTGGVATYRNSNFFGLVDGWDFAVQYQGKNERDELQRSNGDGYGFSTSYVSPIGVGIVGSYSSQDRTNDQNTVADLGRGDRAEFWGTALKYDANNVYLAASYGEGRNATRISGTIAGVGDVSGFANKTQDIELVAQYQFDFGLRPSIAYVQTKGKDIEGVGDVDLVKYFEVGATYYFNKNMSTYVDYIINQIDDDNELGIGSGDTVAVGLVYQF